jgi:hypothetical protein
MVTVERSLSVDDYMGLTEYLAHPVRMKSAARYSLAAAGHYAVWFERNLAVACRWTA